MLFSTGDARFSANPEFPAALQKVRAITTMRGCKSSPGANGLGSQAKSEGAHVDLRVLS